MIELQNICKSYKVGARYENILYDLNLTISQGEFISIMGPSGSGKTSMMNIIGCLDSATSGEYLINKQSITSLNDSQLARFRNESIGFVFQQFHLLPRLTALKNVELPMIYSGTPKKERVMRARNALDRVGLIDKVNFLPNLLSGGQKQRVAIARAIVNKPLILLADEPTGSLDSKNGASILELLTKLNEEGTTIVLVTHDPKISLYTQKTINIIDGKIVDGEKKHEVN